MRNRRIFFFVILLVFPSCTLSHAQQIHFSARDEMMLMAIEQLNEKQQLLGGEIPSSLREEAISGVINQLRDGKQALDKPGEGAQVSGPQGGRQDTPGLGAVYPYIKKFTSRLHPYLVTTTTLNDNVGKIRKKRSSLGYATRAGTRGSYTTRTRNSLNFDVAMSNSYSERHAEDNAQSLAVSSHFNFGLKRSTFTIANFFTTNYIAQEGFGIKTDEQESSWSDSLALAWGKHFNRIGFDLGVSHSESNYENDYNTQDSASDSFSFSQYLFLGRKTRLSLGYSRGRSKHERVPGADSRSDSFSLELAGVVSPKITGAFNADYDMNDIKTGIDSKTKGFGLGFAYRISNRTNLGLNLQHSVYDDSSGDTLYSTDDSFALSGRHRLAFNPRLSLSFSGSVAYKDYPKREGADNNYSVYGIGLGLGYAFRQWFDLGLNWHHSRQYSNFNTDYNENSVVFTTSARF